MSGSFLQNSAKIGALTTALLLLCSCADLATLFQKPAAKPHAAKSQSISATDYATNLSVADMVLASGGSVADISSETKLIESYTKQKKAKAVSQTVVVLEYNDQSGTARKAAAPISEQGTNDALSQVLAHLNATSHSLKEVRVLKATIAPGVAFQLKSRDEAAIRADISARASAIATNGHKLAATDEAKLQVKLLRYFTSAGHRDAAYLCADNAKRLLKSADTASANQLAQDLSSAESDLRQKMPY